MPGNDVQGVFWDKTFSLYFPLLEYMSLYMCVWSQPQKKKPDSPFALAVGCERPELAKQPQLKASKASPTLSPLPGEPHNAPVITGPQSPPMVPVRLPTRWRWHFAEMSGNEALCSLAPVPCGGAAGGVQALTLCPSLPAVTWLHHFCKGKGPSGRKRSWAGWGGARQKGV